MHLLFMSPDPRLQADTTKIISLCMKDSDALDAEALDDSSEDVQSDLQALKRSLLCILTFAVCHEHLHGPLK